MAFHHWVTLVVKANGSRGSEIELSIVVPLYNEETNVELLASKLLDTLVAIGRDFEIILVDDGSSDRTWELTKRLGRQDGRIKGLSLSRNFGHQSALLAGLAHAQGEAIVSMDGDLQHPPETIAQMVEAWRNGYRIVNTRRLDRQSASA